MLAAAASLIILSGCLALEENGNSAIRLEDRIKSTDITVFSQLSPTGGPCLGDQSSTPCKMMVCRNTTSWLATLIPWYEIKLDGGNCTFMDSNITIYNDTIGERENDWWIRTFMLGAGATFTSTDRANLYCNYSLQLTTKWMNGNTTVLPEIPNDRQLARTRCWLERNVLPIYIYNTNGTAIDYQRSLDIATAFGNYVHGTGPAILVSDPFFNSSDPMSVQSVTRQIDAFREGCPKCLVALGVRSGDELALENVLGTAAAPKPVKSKVDMVGFGFRNTDYVNCSPDDIIYENFHFSRVVLENYSLPTLWLYVGASKGQPANNSSNCNWTDESVHNFYQAIFLKTQALASSGVIGMSFYEFSDRTGPLPCAPNQGCDFGLLYGNGSQKLPAMNTWWRACNLFANDTYRSPLMYSSNGQSTSCDFLQNRNMYNLFAGEVNAQRMNYTAVPTFPWNVNGVRPSCGEICPSETEMAKPETYDDVVNAATGEPYGFDLSHCKIYPEIEEMTDLFDVSGIYMRAIIEQESGYDPLVASCTINTSTLCNTERPATQTDARNYYTLPEICALALTTGCHTITGAADCPEGQKPCGLGIAQCTAIPSRGIYPGCPMSNYNPFNPSNSACCGAATLSLKLKTVQVWLNENNGLRWNVLTSCQDGISSSERGWVEYYLASNLYYGALALSPYDNFAAQLNANGPCTGAIPNYIDYLRNMSDPSSPPSMNYSAYVMTRYLDAVDKCQSDCPTAE